MSKMDNLRAMREARYTRRTAQSAQPTPPRPTLPPVAPDPDPVTTDAALCGHRNMSGRTCTRESGHTAKSHRYS